MEAESQVTESKRIGPVAAVARWAAGRRDLLWTLVGLLILIVSLVALSAVLREIRIDDISRAITAIPGERWLVAALLTVLSFACLIVFDVAALRIVERRVPPGLIARGAATSYAVSNTLGLPLLTGGAVRLYFYTRAGLNEADVARVVTLASLAFLLGVFAVFLLLLPLLPSGIALGPVALPDALRFGAPALLIAGLIAYGLWTARRPRTLAALGLSLPLPGPGLTAAQLAAASLDLALAAGVVFVLAPSLALDAFPQLLAAYVLALAVAVITHAPGGFGVFETMVFLLLPEMPKTDLAAALIGYRLIYFLLPFALALLYLAVLEGERLRDRAAPMMRAGSNIARSIAPLTMAAAVFSAGALMILTGALPFVPELVAALTKFLPSVLLDLSHIASSIIGTILMFTAWGLYRRLDVAWLVSVVLLSAGAFLALLRGFDYVEAAVLATVALLLLWTHPAFYRQSALTGERPGGGWLLAIAAVIAGSIFIGFFSYKSVEYQDALWWQIRPGANAPRFLRASLAVAVVAILLALRRLARPARPALAHALSKETWDSALNATTIAEAHLARTGDKFFLVAEAGDAFLMYRVRGRSFIALGSPIGPAERWGELVWKFRELADRHGGRTVFYRCGAEMLPHAVDLGLGIMKLGEEARVPLADFSLEGKPRSKLRHAVSRAEREGVTFRVVEGAELGPLMDELRSVSDEWLAAKRQREKQFSLGRFDPAYLKGGPVALAEKDGHVLAFANLWTLPSREELSFDLMRNRTEMPNGTMDALFARLMLWAKEQGYAHVSLGVAPLSGIESRRLAPIWARLAGSVFRHGERLYGYAGLRRYKEKFLPEWRGRYLAAPRGLAMAMALTDVTMLVSAPPVVRWRRPIRGLRWEQMRTLRRMRRKLQPR